MPPEILNQALELSLEWGEHFGQPVNARIRALHPEITKAEAEALDKWCKEVRYFAFEQVEQEYFEKIPAGAAMQRIRERYPQLNDAVLGRLQSQGMYYAWHG